LTGAYPVVGFCACADTVVDNRAMEVRAAVFRGDGL
jgi:hypothetical protein